MSTEKRHWITAEINRINDYDFGVNRVIVTCTTPDGKQSYAAKAYADEDIPTSEEVQRLTERAIAHSLARSVVDDLSQAKQSLKQAQTEIVELRYLVKLLGGA